MDNGLAEKSLKRGFGWSSQAYWWKDKVNEVPKPGEVNTFAEQRLGTKKTQSATSAWLRLSLDNRAQSYCSGLWFSLLWLLQIKEKLDYLRGLGLEDDQLLEVVKLFPETVGLDLEKRMKPNVELMGKQFFIKGKVLPKTLARKPQALGYAVDCEGDCQGDCTRCWSHF